MNLLNGTCNNCIYRDGKPITCNECEGMVRGVFCLPCNLKAENSFICYQNAYSFNDTSKNSNHLPQPQYENYLCNLCGNNSHDGYDCQQQFPFVYEQESSYNQNYDDNYYPHDSPSFPCCDNCGGSHETFECQLMDQNNDFSGSDQIQTPQHPEIHPPSQEISDEVFQAEGDLMKSIQTFLEEFNYIPFEEKPQILLQAWYKFFAIQYAQTEDSNELFQKLLEDLQIINKELKCNRPIFFDNNEDHSGAKQKMEDTMLELVKMCEEKELLCMHDNVDDLIESALNSKLLSINSQRLNKEKQEVKNVVEQPAERGNRIIESLQNFRVIHKSSTSLKNTNDDLTSSDGESLFKEDVPIEESKVYSNPLFDDDEINSDELESHVESNFVESLSNHDALIDSSQKIDYLEEFSGELAHINPEIIESDFDFEEEIHLIENLLYDNSSSRPPKELNAKIAYTIIESLPSLPISIQDDDSQREEIDIVTETDDVLPLSVEKDDDSEEDIQVFKELLSDNSIPLTEDESSDSDHQDDPSFSRPPLEPPDADFKPDAREEIPVVMYVNDELECIDPRDEFNVSNDEDDDYFPFMFVIQILLPYLSILRCFFLFSSLRVRTDTIFDPVISVSSLWIYPLLIEVSCVQFYCPGPQELHILSLRLVWENLYP
nr:hypothetical protein [Tanacetum cinerariifolium]